VNRHNYERIGLLALQHFYEMYKPFGNWYGPCDYGPMGCITFNGPNSVGWLCEPATSCAGATGVMNPFNQGCGNAHSPQRSLPIRVLQRFARSRNMRALCP
jgi:hypothetical protein